MLDNIMLPTTGGAAAASPLAETKCEDINKFYNATNASPSSSPTNKAKTIFNWLRSATKANTTATESNNAKSNSSTADCTCKTVAPVSLSKSKQFPDASLRDFRGVQSLRHLWNKRISANEEASTATRCNKTTFGSNKGNKLTKSISCLVNATAINSETPTNKTDELRRRLQSKRAQSLHDCTQLDDEEKVEAEAAQTEDEITAEPHAEIHFLHREKDNFYKYKTAEQAAKHIAREASVRAAKTRRFSAGIVSGGTVDDAHFPATTTNGGIHWLRRQDIDAGSSKQTTTERRATDAKKMAVDDNKGITTTLSARDVISNDCCTDDIRNAQTCFPAAVAPDSVSVSSDDTDTLTAANSPRYAASRRRHTKREVSSPTSVSSAKRGSTDSSSSNVTTLAGRSSGARRTLSSASSTRKYSFKTHAPRTYHVTRKMNIKDGSGTSSGTGGASSSFSMVAKLTQQFNEIIQKDKKLLEEVKRKKGVLMSRGGHVYKVVENTAELSRTSSSSKTASPSISRTGSLANDQPTTTTTSSMVQRNIKKFENRLDLVVCEKPTVPTKSAQVLRKRNEFVKSHHNGLSPNSSSKRLNLCLNLPPQSSHAEFQLKLEAKKKTHVASAILEVVREEAKSPLEAEEKSIATSVPVAVTTTGQLKFEVASNAKNAEVTYATINSKKRSEAMANGVNEAATNVFKQTQFRDAANDETTTEGGSVENPLTTLAMRQPEEAIVMPRLVASTSAKKIEPPQQVNDAKKTNEANTEEVDATNVVVTIKTLRNEEVEVNTDDVNDSVNDEKVKQRKHKYAKIYEKFRFRSPFGSSQSKKTSPPSRSPDKSTDSEKKTMSTDEITPELLAELVKTTSGDEAEAKILDALEVIDQKLKGLTVHETEMVLINHDVEAKAAAAIILCENDDFEQRVLPNSSFVHQASAKQVSNNQLLVTQAVNVALVNSLEGEQMIMEQKELQKQQQAKLITELDSKTENDQQEDEEAIYEPIATGTVAAVTALPKQPKTEPEPNPQQSFIFKRCTAGSKSNEAVCENTIDDIYQTLEEAQLQKKIVIETDHMTITTTAVATTTDMLNDYESIAGSCEQAIPAASMSTKILEEDDDYEMFEPPGDESTLQVATTNSATSATTPTIMRNTNDELPELPKPRRRLPKSPMPGPPKPAELIVSDTKSTVISNIVTQELLDDHDVDDDQHYYADDENIYDTIKGSHCYESLNSAEGIVKLQKSGSVVTKSSSGDTVSLTSNCYESITHYRRLVTATNGQTPVGGSGGSRCGSTLTISSDHKTNSLYEVSLAAGLLYGVGSLSCGRSGSSVGSTVGGASVGSSMPNSTTGGERRDSSGAGSSKHYPHSNAASSDNSDGWIDISDAEADSAKGAHVARQQFIVVRERSKLHRSPDWSKRVRDKRLHQKKAMSCIEDDSDHYYESLSPLGTKRHSSQLVQRTSSSLQHHRRNQDLPRYVVGASQRSKKFSASAHALGHGVSDDYDSFDTDTDDIYETEGNMKNQHNDSGVDIRNVKLPDPPPSTNQVYAMVKKLKNFISNKKSPSSGHKHGSGSQQKLYENSSQFYVEGNIYENTPKIKAKSLKSSQKLSTPTHDGDNDIYENTEFHTPPDVKLLSTSERNLSTTTATQQDTDLPNTTAPTPTSTIGGTTTLRSKSKSGKSFKSRLRKSLVGSSFDTKQLSALSPTRSTFYIEDPTHGGSGELDSGFSEKASSGDLPAVDVGSVPTSESQKFATVARKTKKETKSANTQRRRTTIGIRPHEPPPPPPEDAKVKHHSVAATTTSWYAECGVFKNGGGNIGRAQDDYSLSGSKSTLSQNGSSMMGNGTSWYAEAGLYQTSGVSVASSSGSSGVSTGNEGGLSDDMPHSMFLNEPLYQIYSAAKLESISRDMEDHDGSTDGYEEIGQNGGAGRDAGTQLNEDSQKRARPSALQLVGPKNGPSRTLWSEIPEVINSCILPTLTPRERGLQEAKFEIITSEASYLKSLNLLRSHFMMYPLFRDTSVLSARDRKALFSYIVPVHECSERLLTELESCWQDNIMLLGLSRRIYAVAERYFHVYIAFCEHQGRMDRTLRRLKAAKGVFSQNLDLLEASATCCGLNLHSFLMLPMQRITRLPLLIDAVFSKVSSNDDEYDSWKMTLAIMNKIVTQCNEAANRCEQAYEIERISRQLEFPTSIRALAIAPMGVSAPGSKPRFLVKKGELTHLIWRGDDAKLTFGKKFTKTTIFAFLFSDLLVLTKRKAEAQFLVFDYCPRSMLTISSGDALPQLPTKDISQTSKHLILMTLLENNERKTVELVLACPSVSEQERWLQAMRPPEAETPGEKLYEQWDCPQVIVKHGYEGSKEPDVLNLEIGDVVNVTRKLPDGWYQGERIRDGAIGWFPGSFTEEVNSAHVRARNLKQRYRLLTFTATYLESQKRK